MTEIRRSQFTGTAQGEEFTVTVEYPPGVIVGDLTQDSSLQVQGLETDVLPASAPVPLPENPSLEEGDPSHEEETSMEVQGPEEEDNLPVPLSISIPDESSNSDESSTSESSNSDDTSDATAVKGLNADQPMTEVVKGEQSTGDEVLSDPVFQAPKWEVLENGSKRRQPLLVNSHGFAYTQKRNDGKRRYWVCSKQRTKGVQCRASVIQEGSQFTMGKFQHCHEGERGTMLKKRLREVTLNMAYGGDAKQSAPQIVKNAYTQFSDICQSADVLPKFKTELRAVYRAQGGSKLNGVKENKFKLELESAGLPNEYLLGDVEVSGARHLIFATDDQQKLLAKAHHIYMDSMVKVVQSPFEQLLSFHAYVRWGDCIRQQPLLFVVMSKRRQVDYEKVFERVQQVVDINPDTFVLDFETPLWNALKKMFPDAHLHGCTYHWCQNVYRKICSFGLQPAYKQQGDVHHLLKKLLALPLLPDVHIKNAFSELEKQGQGNSQLERVFSYVKDHWIQSSEIRIENWCAYQRLVRSTEDADGWSNKLKQYAGQSNRMNIYRLLEVLYGEGKLVDAQCKMLPARVLSTSKRKASKQDELFKLWGLYAEGNNMSTEEFLEACASFLPV